MAASPACATTLSPIAYNTKLVKADQAPKSFADLLDKKWSGKIVKAHPGYSGGIVTSTFQTSRDLGWDYFEKARQAARAAGPVGDEPPKKLALGERPIMADGLEYLLLLMKEKAVRSRSSTPARAPRSSRAVPRSPTRHLTPTPPAC